MGQFRKLLEAQVVTVLKAKPYNEVSDVFYNKASGTFYKENQFNGAMILVKTFKSIDIERYDIQDKKLFKELQKIK